MDDLAEIQALLRAEEKCNHCIKGSIVRNLEKDKRLLAIIKRRGTAGLLIYSYCGDTPMAQNLRLEYALPVNKEFSVSV
ncbi:Hypothetical predicted protein, partial [Paramuricea clavata]